MGINVDDVWVVDDAGEGVENVDGARMRPGVAICDSLREANLVQTWLDKEGERKRGGESIAW